MQCVEARSSRRLQDEFPNLGKRNWVSRLRVRGHHCPTAGTAVEQTVPHFNERQTWDVQLEVFRFTAPSATRAEFSRARSGQRDPQDRLWVGGRWIRMSHECLPL